MRFCRTYLLFFCLCALQLPLAGCFQHEQVRHLSSDICLITPNLTQKEVVGQLGPPDERKTTEDGEVWIYRAVKKSTLRKTPLIGKHLGAKQYDIVTITFAGDRVNTCAYRSYDEDEYPGSGTATDEPQED